MPVAKSTALGLSDYLNPVRLIFTYKKTVVVKWIFPLAVGKKTRANIEIGEGLYES